MHFRSGFIKITFPRFPRKVSRTKRNIAIGKKGKHSNTSNDADTYRRDRRTVVKKIVSRMCVTDLLPDFHRQQRAVISNNIRDNARAYSRTVERIAESHVEATGIKILMSNGRPPSRERRLFSGRFYGGNKSSFPVASDKSYASRGACFWYSARRAIPIMELHADTWTVYTRAWCIGGCRAVGRLRVACVRSRRDETRCSFGSSMPRVSLRFACRLEILGRQFRALFCTAVAAVGTVARAMEFLTLRVNFSQRVEWNTFAEFRPIYLGASCIYIVFNKYNTKKVKE